MIKADSRASSELKTIGFTPSSTARTNRCSMSVVAFPLLMLWPRLPTCYSSPKHLPWMPPTRKTLTAMPGPRTI